MAINILNGTLPVIDLQLCIVSLLRSLIWAIFVGVICQLEFEMFDGCLLCLFVI